jgi:hypothetical protein
MLCQNQDKATVTHHQSPNGSTMQCCSTSFFADKKYLNVKVYTQI